MLAFCEHMYLYWEKGNGLFFNQLLNQTNAVNLSLVVHTVTAQVQYRTHLHNYVQQTH